MERKDRKRKAAEIAESPEFVSATITELTLALRENDAKLREEISSLRDELGSLKTQLADKSDECDKLQVEAAFLHPDAVIDRARTKLWHHGDLSLLRKVIDPMTRVLRNTEGRYDRTLYLCESAPKKANGKPQISSSRTSELSPKHESEEASTPAPPPTDSVPNTNEGGGPAEEKEDDYVSVPLPTDNDNQVTKTPQQEMTATEQELAEGVLMDGGA
ncbi:hypothetical protein PF005_g24039 [Phytophthora fragariae]|uniref:Uncharacterized protein n=2 Tax=Phytophthora TaxID=4783 RepID=A0A6A3IHE0_9STRA|nr:hypothetical protein PF003_g40041 [Phytophthora fragariae]KAE9033949.1 hypothetical protein PR002_g8399 [Phytophthora rubi]KAE8924857.1 hypothetical protein PF009_g24920 [Phytophthora fragariae]KAE8979564.1 hypothetical protein PF011_g22794 [Phytophthora fragariae]KAE9036608.1 hypothetical protein PR001_g8744 [Phytophthora rubi]